MTLYAGCRHHYYVTLRVIKAAHRCYPPPEGLLSCASYCHCHHGPHRPHDGFHARYDIILLMLAPAADGQRPHATPTIKSDAIISRATPLNARHRPLFPSEGRWLPDATLFKPPMTSMPVHCCWYTPSATILVTHARLIFCLLMAPSPRHRHGHPNAEQADVHYYRPPWLPLTRQLPLLWAPVFAMLPTPSGALVKHEHATVFNARYYLTYAIASAWRCRHWYFSLSPYCATRAARHAIGSMASALVVWSLMPDAREDAAVPLCRAIKRYHTTPPHHASHTIDAAMLMAPDHAIDTPSFISVTPY